MVLLRYDAFVKDEGGVEVKPEEVIKAKREWTGDEGGKYQYVKKFLDDFEITNNVSDYTTSNIMEKWMEEKRFGVSHILFTKELRSYCVEQGLNIVERRAKKICGKPTRVWVGIKQIQYIPEREVETEEYELQEA